MMKKIARGWFLTALCMGCVINLDMMSGCLFYIVNLTAAFIAAKHYSPDMFRD